MQVICAVEQLKTLFRHKGLIGLTVVLNYCKEFRISPIHHSLRHLDPFSLLFSMSKNNIKPFFSWTLELMVVGGMGPVGWAEGVWEIGKISFEVHFSLVFDWFPTSLTVLE